MSNFRDRFSEFLNNFEKLLLIIFLFFEKKTCVIFSKFSIFLILFLILLLGFKKSTVESILGLGKKQLGETLNLFKILNL